MINIEFDKENLVKSPLNYVGGKYKLLPQILPLFPDNINTFMDLFCGGCNVGINVKANKIVCNDSLTQIINLFNSFKDSNKNKIFSSILSIIESYKLSDSTKLSYEDYNCDSSGGLGKYNKDAYLKLRNDYNEMDKNTYQSNIMFYTLVCYSFSNQIRFNSKGGFNMPYGKRDFNKNIRSNLEKFLNKLGSTDITFVNKDFRALKTDNLTNSDFVYCDPPYLITCATYNENDGWSETKEKELLALLDKLNEKGVKFALSNVLEDKGKENYILKEWANKYHINYLNHTYSNCNYQVKDKEGKTVEVLITNYIN